MYRLRDKTFASMRSAQIEEAVLNINTVEQKTSQCVKKETESVICMCMLICRD